MFYYISTASKLTAVLGLLVFIAFSDADVSAFPNFDGDTKADFGVFRPNDNTWYAYSSEAKTFSGVRWGLSDDRLVPGDYDGDGLTDTAVLREDTYTWYILGSRNRQVFSYRWGTKTNITFGVIYDEPVPADYDGDGHDDIAVWRPSEGAWYILLSSSGFSPNYARYFHWGALGDVPVPADYDGDGKADYAVFRPTENRWYIRSSRDESIKAVTFGQAGYDLLVPADYTGDGKADLAVYRGGTWLIRDSATGQISSYQFGLPTDSPAPADYNGDGKTDLAVFRGGTWFIYEINNPAYFQTFQFGQPNDVPINSAYVKPSIVAIP